MTDQTNPFVTQQKAPAGTAEVKTVVTPEVVPEEQKVVATPVGGGIPAEQKVVAAAEVPVPAQTEAIPAATANDQTVVGAVVPAQGTVPAVTQPEGVMNLTFDDDIKINTLDKLPKLKKEETSRIGFLLFDANNSPLIKMSYYFYDDVARKLFLAPKDKNLLAKVVSKLGEPKIRFGTPVIRYQTDQYGNLPEQWSYSIHAFIFSTDKFPILKALHKEWGLQGHDILMTCTEPEFQKLAMNVARESLWRTLPQEYLEDIHTKATEAYEKHINRMMGRPMKDEEILALLGLAGPPAAAAGQGVVNPFPAGNANQPAERMAGQVGTGTPANAEFGHLVNK